MKGIPYNSMGSNQSNYIVSNDGLGLTEFSNLSPKPIIPNNNKPMSNGPKLATPTLIPPLKYIVYNNPQAAYNFLANMGYSVRPDIPSTYQFAKLYIRERGEQGVLDIVRAAHPDLDTIFKAFNIKEKESSYSGDDARLNTPGATTGPVTEVPATATPKKEEKTGIKMTANTIILILIFVIFIILVTRK